jgi:Xaa-Pro dipeptidase
VRLAALRERAGLEGLDGVLLLPGPNMRYFLGVVTESYERLTLCFLSFRGPSSMLVPRLDLERVRDQLVVEDVELLPYADDEDPWQIVGGMLEKSGLDGGTLGVEGQVPFKVFSRLKGLSSGLTLRGADEVFYGLRVVKDEHEVEAHRRASRILQEALRATLRDMREGVEEREVKLLFERNALALGAESVPFCLVQSGPNAAKPHLEPTERRLREGELVVLDAGVTWGGYFADVTRTVCLGEPGEEQRSIFEVVLRAQSEAIQHARPGVRAEELDRAARGVIAQHGYGPYFIHRTGHGLGLEVHEEPFIREGSPTKLARGMVFTVEPGIYLPGRLGVRLEDNLVVTDQGCENLTYLPKSIRVEDYH